MVRGPGGAVGSPLPPGPCSDPPSQIRLPPSKLLNGEHRLLQLKPGPILGKQSGVFSKTGPGSTAQPNSDHRGCFHPVFLGERRPARCLPVPPSSGPGGQVKYLRARGAGRGAGPPPRPPEVVGSKWRPLPPAARRQSPPPAGRARGASPAASLPPQAAGGSPGTGRASRTPLTSRAPATVSPSTSLSPSTRFDKPKAARTATCSWGSGGRIEGSKIRL